MIKISMKTCKKCGAIKGLNEFYQHPYKKDGHNNACISCCRKYNAEWHKKYYSRFPWLTHWKSAQQRCQNPHQKNYPRYGERGITFELTRDETRILWHRNHADDMVNPVLHRINSDGPYSVKNCKFIEKRKHDRLGVIKRWNKNPTSNNPN